MVSDATSTVGVEMISFDNYAIDLGENTYFRRGAADIVGRLGSETSAIKTGLASPGIRASQTAVRRPNSITFASRSTRPLTDGGMNPARCLIAQRAHRVIQQVISYSLPQQISAHA